MRHCLIREDKAKMNVLIRYTNYQAPTMYEGLPNRGRHEGAYLDIQNKLDIHCAERSPDAINQNQNQNQNSSSK